MPQTSGVVSTRMIDGENREIMYLDRITNAYCIHRDNNATTPVGASRKNNQLQFTSSANRANAYSFTDSNNLALNNYFLDVQSLRDHLHALMNCYRYNIFQNYYSLDPNYEVNGDKWVDNLALLNSLVQTYGGGNWDSLEIRFITLRLNPTDTGYIAISRNPGGGRGGVLTPIRTNPDQDEACWDCIQAIVLPNISIPYLVKMDTNVFHIKFEIKESLSLLTSSPTVVTPTPTDLPRNWLWVGAPGTGKSFDLNAEAERYVAATTGGSIADDIFKMTFHPSTSYFDFIGDYRPLTLYDSRVVPPYLALDSSPVVRPGEISIDYSFVPGIFLNAFIRAIENPTLKIVVIIDEINRGNIFDIMGEVLHLMERQSLTSATPYFGSNKVDLSEHAMAYLRSISSSFSEVRLPENLYLWATMNPNDHSVHRIDSAFVRRWTTKYVGINNGSRVGMYTVPNPINLDWETLRTRINDKLENEESMIGFWYLKPFEFTNWELFYSKLVYHLANNVVKNNLGCLFLDDLDTVLKVMEACSNDTSPFRSTITP
jgi:hypothetical protein